MNLSDYQKEVHLLSTYPTKSAMHYLIPGLLSAITQMEYSVDRRFDVQPTKLDKIGDALWFCSELLLLSGYELQIHSSNIAGVAAALDISVLEAVDLCDTWLQRVKADNLKIDDAFKDYVYDRVNHIVEALSEIAVGIGSYLDVIAEQDLRKRQS